MLVEVKVPVLAESVPDATLLNWYKQVGERVERGESLIDLETDKVTLEIAAPEGGVLKEIRRQTGEVVLTNDILAVIDTEGTAVIAGPALAVAAAATPINAPQPGPAARKLAAEAGIDPTTVQGSGKDGRVTKSDIVASASKPPAAPAASTPPAPVRDVQPQVVTVTGRVEERVPMTRLRKRTAERLLAAQRDNALLTTFNEVNMQPVMDLRNRFKGDFEDRYGVKLGFMSFFVKAAVEALKKFPVVNAAVDGDDIIYHGFFDIGVAVGSERGLVVPILRDVERMSFADVERRIRDFGERARDGKLTIDELTGGTFTVTTTGAYGGLLATPIVHHPQVAILGVHEVKKKPAVVNDQIVIRELGNLSLSLDHRIVDGAVGADFLYALIERLEHPERWLTPGDLA